LDKEHLKIIDRRPNNANEETDDRGFKSTEQAEVSPLSALSKSDPLESAQIDLGNPHDDSPDKLKDPRKNPVKQKKEGDCISVIGPNEALLDTPQPSRKTPAGQNVETSTAKRKSYIPSTPKTQQMLKSPKGQTKATEEKKPEVKTDSNPLPFSPKPVILSKGVAYLQGNMIKLTGGVKLHPGDQIKIGDKEFALRAGKRKKTWLYLSAAVIVLAAFLFLTPFFKSGHDATLVGIAIEENSGRIIPGTTITLKELNRTVQSDEHGFFVFESLPPGSYVLNIASENHQSRNEKIEIAKNRSLTLQVNLIPSATSEPKAGSTAEAVSSKKSAAGKKSSGQGTTGSTLGAVKIETNVTDPTILIDNRLAGAGNKVYPDIQPGKHIIAVTKEGYYDWAKEVKIGSGKTLSLEVVLSEDKTKHPDAQAWKDFVALGNSRLNNGDLSAAMNAYNKALDLKPGSADALLGRGFAYLKMGDKSKASADFRRSAEGFEKDGDYRNAALSYSNLLSLNDKDLESLLGRGICHLRLGEYQSSISDLEKAVGLNKASFDGHLNLGEAYYRTGDFKRSIESYKRAGKIDSGTYQVFMGLTKAYYAKGDKSKAKKSYKDFEKVSTYINREKFKEDQEWREILEGIGVESQR
jgi:Flp pilus assembly protein TadD